jgi:peptidoglycan/LPS O-acetylase OafA/YrhL
MVVLGEASYSIYLLHFTLICFFYYTFEVSGTNPKLALTAYLLTLPVVSIGSWMYIETPLRKWIAAKVGTRHRSQPAACLPTSALP